VLHVEDEFTLTDIASKLEKLDVYRPVMHFAWTQVTRPEEETQPIELRALAEPAEGRSPVRKRKPSRSSCERWRNPPRDSMAVLRCT
jgi:hypothetical protein